MSSIRAKSSSRRQSNQERAVRPPLAGPPATGQSADGRLAAAVCALLVVAVLLVFGQTGRFNFVNFDDPEYVSENAHVRSGLTPAGVAWAFRPDELTANWHPLTWLSLMIDCQIFGPNRPGAFHLTNVLLHAVNSVVLLLTLRKMTGQIWPSALVAAVFAVHPLHVESVAWITERKDVVSGLFGLLAIWAYAWYARKPGLFRYLAVAAALALGLMAKSMLVTWPLLLLLLDYWPLRRPLGLGLLLEKLPLMAMAGTVAAVAFLAQRAAGSVASLESASLLQRVARAGPLYLFYLAKTFWPRNLAIYSVEPMPTCGRALAAGILLLSITAAAVWAGRRGARWLAVGWFWYLGTLLPTIGLVQVGTELTADRFVYLPQIGLCIALAWTAAEPLRRWQGPDRGPSKPEAQASGATRSLASASGFDRHAWAASTSCLGVALLLAVLTACAWQQTSYWRDSNTLWTHALDCTSRNFMAHFKLAKAMERDGKLDAAIEHYRAAVEIRPGDAAARNNLGALLEGRGDVDGAIEQFEAGLKDNPKSPELNFNAATLLARLRRFDAAIAHYKKVLEIAPNYVPAKEGLARARAGLTP
jgi:tetratricopeptide (TPR) repeat protein